MRAGRRRWRHPEAGRWPPPRVRGACRTAARRGAGSARRRRGSESARTRSRRRESARRRPGGCRDRRPERSRRRAARGDPPVAATVRGRRTAGRGCRAASRSSQAAAGISSTMRLDCACGWAADDHPRGRGRAEHRTQLDRAGVARRREQALEASPVLLRVQARGPPVAGRHLEHGDRVATRDTRGTACASHVTPRINVFTAVRAREQIGARRQRDQPDAHRRLSAARPPGPCGHGASGRPRSPPSEPFDQRVREAEEAEPEQRRGDQRHDELARRECRRAGSAAR